MSRTDLPPDVQELPRHQQLAYVAWSEWLDRWSMLSPGKVHEEAIRRARMEATTEPAPPQESVPAFRAHG